jgi:hypothetical protein
VRTVQAFENGKKMPHPNSIAPMQRAIEAAGISLLFDDQDGIAMGIAVVRTPGG